MSRKLNCILRFRILSKIMLQLSLFNGFQILQLRLVSFQIVVHNAIQVWKWWLIPFLIMWCFQPSKIKLPTAFSCKSKRKYLSLFNRKARLYQCKYRVSHWPWLMADFKFRDYWINKWPFPWAEFVKISKYWSANSSIFMIKSVFSFSNEWRISIKHNRIIISISDWLILVLSSPRLKLRVSSFYYNCK